MIRRPILNRRSLILAASKVALAGVLPGWSFAAFASADAASMQRFVFVIQRGAADGLHMVVPVGDPAYVGLRAGIAPDAAGLLRLDDHFALHPAMSQLHAMYGQSEALFVHAVASPYKGNRSHFDAQNVLESGGNAPYALRDGWLNRLAALMPNNAPEPLAISATLPLALRGDRRAASYAPAGLREPSADLQARVTQMYDADPGLHALWQSALDTRRMAEPGARQDPASLGKLAAGFLRRSDGPRLAMLETTGWDTHAGQVGRMNGQLKNLDALLAALREGLGDAWQHTTVLVATEFGRTAAVNGTGGTDHGTASVAMLVGGAVKAGRHGGRVLADWPGLAPQQLLEGRDLRATTQLDAVIAAAASQTLNLPPDRVSHAVFPQMGRVALPEGLAAVSPPVRA